MTSPTSFIKKLLEDVFLQKKKKKKKTTELERPSGFQILELRVTGFNELYLLSLMEKSMAPHSSTLTWKIPWTEEPGRLQSMGSLRVGHN